MLMGVNHGAGVRGPQDESLVPPHPGPGPLPWGEGEIDGRFARITGIVAETESRSKTEKNGQGSMVNRQRIKKSEVI